MGGASWSLALGGQFEAARGALDNPSAPVGVWSPSDGPGSANGACTSSPPGRFRRPARILSAWIERASDSPPARQATAWSHIERLTIVVLALFLASALLLPIDVGIAAAAGAVVLGIAGRAEFRRAVKQGYTLLVLSDRGVTPSRAPIPSLLAVSAVHHGLLRSDLRGEVGLVVESGEPREVMHFCLLCGFGANAVNPYLTFEVRNTGKEAVQLLSWYTPLEGISGPIFTVVGPDGSKVLYG